MFLMRFPVESAFVVGILQREVTLDINKVFLHFSRGKRRGLLGMCAQFPTF